MIIEGMGAPLDVLEHERNPDLPVAREHVHLRAPMSSPLSYRLTLTKVVCYR
jgi:hypothetical protein